VLASVALTVALWPRAGAGSLAGASDFRAGTSLSDCGFRPKAGAGFLCCGFRFRPRTGASLSGWGCGFNPQSRCWPLRLWRQAPWPVPVSLAPFLGPRATPGFSGSVFRAQGVCQPLTGAVTLSSWTGPSLLGSGPKSLGLVPKGDGTTQEMLPPGCPQIGGRKDLGFQEISKHFDELALWVL